MSSRSMSRASRFATASTIAALVTNAFAAGEVAVSQRPIETSHVRLGISQTLRSTQGSFDPYGYYLPNPEGSTSVSVLTSLSAAYRMSQRWEFGIILPLRQSRMIMPTGDSSVTSVGGINANIRYHHGGWPHLVIHVGAGTPWTWKHLSMNGNPRDSLQAEDMADGLLSGTSLSLGAGVSRTFHPVRLAFDATLLQPVGATELKGDPSQPAHYLGKAARLQLMEGLSYSLDPGWTVHSGLKQVWAGKNSYDGVVAEGTASRVFSASAGVTYAPSRSWTWIATHETQWPFYGYAVNQPYSPSLMLSMTYSTE